MSKSLKSCEISKNTPNEDDFVFCCFVRRNGKIIYPKNEKNSLDSQNVSKEHVMATNTNNNYRKGSVKGLQNGAMFEVCNLIEIDFRFSHISILGKNNDGEIMTIKRILN